MAPHTYADTPKPRILRAIRAASSPVGVSDLAEQLGMHPNTIRFHLGSLDRAGDVQTIQGEPRGRGRPRILYRRSPTSRHGDRSYEVFARVLVESFGTGESGRKRGIRAGTAWGRDRAKDLAHGRGSVVEKLVELFDEEGFAPRRTGPGTVELHHCPFHELAVTHGDVVCAVHDGLMRGALARWGAPETTAVLEPFAEPGLCRAHLEGTAQHQRERQ